MVLERRLGDWLGLEFSLGVTEPDNAGLCNSVGLLLGSVNVGNSLGLEEGLDDGPELSLGVTEPSNVWLDESVGLLLNSLGIEDGLDDGPELLLGAIEPSNVGLCEGSEDAPALSVGAVDGETLGDVDISFKNMDSTACSPSAVSPLLPPVEPEVEEPNTLASRKVAPETVSS
jgi:hypothetical protein